MTRQTEARDVCQCVDRFDLRQLRTDLIEFFHGLQSHSKMGLFGESFFLSGRNQTDSQGFAEVKHIALAST